MAEVIDPALHGHSRKTMLTWKWPLQVSGTIRGLVWTYHPTSRLNRSQRPSSKTQFRKVTKEAGVTTEGDTADTLESALQKIRTKCGKHVNLSMAIFKLMHARQGTKSVTEFEREIDELTDQCQFDTTPYDKDRARKDAFIFGTADDKLRQEALGKDFAYEQVMKAALGYEQSRRASGTIKQSSGEDVRQITYSQDDVDSIVARVLAGKYSKRQSVTMQKTENKQGSGKCRNCPPHYKPHITGRCPATGKTCVVCKGKNHFAGAPVCPSKQSSVRAVETQPERLYSYQNTGDCRDTMGYVEVVDIGLLHESRSENMALIDVNNARVKLFVDSGCKKTLIPTTYYQPEIGKTRPSMIKLRPYGTDQYLGVKGEVPVTLKAASGATIKTVVYIVEGHLAEPILGDEDAKALGILTINPNGKPTSEVAVACITSNLKAAGISVKTTIEAETVVPPDEQTRIQAIVDRYPSVVHRDLNTAGLLKDLKKPGDASVKFYIDTTVPPVQARYHPPPIAYHKRLSKHLQEMRE